MTDLRETQSTNLHSNHARRPSLGRFTGRLLLASAMGSLAALAVAPQAAQAQFACENFLSPFNASGADASGAATNFNVACGTSANASGDNSGNTALGNGSNASTGAGGSTSENTAIGRLANASGDRSRNIATGAAANASGSRSNNTATGFFADASASGGFSRNTATGQFANANGTESSNVAIGDRANGRGDNSANVAMGSEANAIGDGSRNVATGFGANASGDGTSNTAVGAFSTATGMDSTAVGANASATHAYSAAFGHDATTTRANQQVFGTANNTYTMPGITSDASRSAQSGPLEMVTSDGAGNLATDGGEIFKNASRNEAGVAAAMALQNPDLRGDMTFAVAANVGFFEDSTALGFTALGQVGENMLGMGEKIAVGGGVSFSVDESSFSGRTDDAVGGRVGVEMGW